MARWSKEEHDAALVGPERPIDGVVIEDYDPRWPDWFAAERDAIRTALGANVPLRLEHTGSTSVPGLAAKPIIDMLMVLADTTNEQTYVPALEAIGYRLAMREPNWYDHRVLTRRRTDGDPYDVNLHVFPPTAATEIERILAFRDWLRRHPEDRQCYERIKRGLAQRSWTYMLDYSNAKSEIVEEILTRALTGESDGGCPQ